MDKGQRTMERTILMFDRFGSTVGQFCLLAGLRAQVSPGREGEFKEVSQERYVQFNPSSSANPPSISLVIYIEERKEG
jgi:hypothetical protein